MELNRIMPWSWRRYLVAVALVAVASALRLWPLQSLGSTLAWLTFYPVVMIAAIYGGLSAGLLATGLACLIAVFGWSLLVAAPFIKGPADVLGMAVFVLTCTMISFVAEATRRANLRAREAQERAEAASKSKSVFLANMSHELRTPLNAILGFSGLMRNEPGLSDQQRGTLDIINRSGEHLLSLINDVLDMAKIEAGGTVLENDVFDLGGMVRDVMDLMGQRAAEKDLALLVDRSPDFPRYVRADAGKLRQVLVNLLGNALKFTERGGVTVRLHARPMTEPDRSLLVMEVEDTGVGIPAASQATVFDAFIQVGGASPQRGTGLGLAITRTYVELMGGRVAVQSAEGSGSIFRVEVPVDRASEEDAAAGSVGTGPRRVVSLEPGQPPCRILIVEDQMENWSLLRRLMEEAGFQVRIAENGALGVEAFREWRPHLIWMDVRMPVMDGLEATRRIRVLEGGGDVRIVALTASAFLDERDNVMAAGMDDLVRKPYKPNEVFECAERLLGIRLVREEIAAPGPAAPAGVIDLRALADLPAGLRGELTGAVVGLDRGHIAEVVSSVREYDPALGVALARHSDGMSYTAILQALRSVESGIATIEEDDS
jgi:signal transduction histidine kinase/ActR/RegA family two-component response regulator